MKKAPKIFLRHILESILLLENYTENKCFEDFSATVSLQDMVIRRLEIIGEAVKNLPEQLKQQNPDIPWPQIAGMRDKLIHNYFGVDLRLTWNVVTSEIPNLKLKVESLLNNG